jgi:glutathione synthase/RimK-type ligase-like ATP-grasp enzyme
VIALATAAELPGLDPDDQPLLDVLDATPAVWDDPGVDWDAFEAVVVRSTWDYTGRRDEFVRWAERIGERLHNPPAVVRWNTDKRYLGELAAAGLPVVETAFLDPGEPLRPPPHPFVVKPVVSAGSQDTVRYAAGEDAGGHVATLHAAGRPVMVQPYLEAVDEVGETALLYIDGAYSHAIRKGAMLTGTAEEHVSGLYQAEEITPREPSAAEQAVGDRVMAWVAERFGTLLYARVDLLPGADGEPTLLELELTEPSLFFAHADGALERFAAGVRRRR